MQGRSLLLLLKRSSHATSFRLQAQVEHVFLQLQAPGSTVSTKSIVQLQKKNRSEIEL